MLTEKLEMCDVTGDCRDIAEFIGIEAFRKLIYLCEGQVVYFPKVDMLIKSARDKRIAEAFNGGNYKEISRKFSLSERRIRAIINEQNRLQ